MSISFKYKNVLIDEDNNVNEFPVKHNLKKNLIEISDTNCIRNILSSKEALCIKTNVTEIKEIATGIILSKNVKESQIIQNCNKLNIKIKGNYLIKFKNCKINIRNKTYENCEKTIHNKFILPTFR